MGVSMSLRQTPDYTGVDNLEVMEDAINYNTFLVDLVAHQLAGRRNVLDFGAGTGYFATGLRERGVAVTCVEPDRTLATKIRARSIPVVSALTEISDGSVGGIYSLNVLEHIEDDAQTLRDLARVLQPAGRLVLFVPAFQLLYSGMDRKVGHVRRYRVEPLNKIVTAAGLRVITSHYADCLGFAASLVYRALDNGEGRINLRALKAYDSFVFPISRRLDLLTRRWFGKNIVLVADKALQ
jgi:SAM-dependent methyltransferase